MATLVIRHPDGTEEEVELTQSLTVGRAEGNDLILTEGGVSRRHARFFVEDGQVYVEDTASANGTWVDQERIEGPSALSAKSQVVIGDYEVMVKEGGGPRRPTPAKKPSGAPRGRAPSTPTGREAQAGVRRTKVIPVVKVSGEGALARRQAPRRAAGPQLRGVDGPLVGKTFALSGTMTIGRVVGNDIVLDDDSVSRRHAELEVSGDGVVLRDLGSANGTRVNGAPIDEGAPLAPGDVIQLGVVELMFENAAPQPRALARGRSPRGGRAEAREDRLARSEPPGEGPLGDPKKRLMIIGGSVVGLLMVLLVVKVLMGGGEVAARRSSAPPVEVDPEAQLEALLTECRTYASPEIGKPDWARAKAACEKIIELEPIHVDANTLLKRIQTEKACEENLQRAKELVLAGRLEDAVEAYAKVGANERDCPTYYLRALDAARDPVEELKARTGRECKDYANNGKWENAYRRCEVYIRLACQTMDPTELLPPPGQVLKLDGRVGRGEWRPPNPLYVDFLKAREKLKPGEPLWQCPTIRAFRPAQKPKSVDETILKDFRDRFHSNDMGDALFLYFKGKENEAQVPLHKIIENMSRASEHDRARALLQDITQAQNLFQAGSAELTNERPEKAAIPFRQALVVDERLILGERASTAGEEEKRRELERRASYLRRIVTEQMASVCYNRGKTSADRNDFRQACRFWKLGASFSRSNIDLLRALTNVCTSRAQDAMRQAGTCAQLKQVLDFAVEGDGYRQEAEAKLNELGCPSESK